MSRSVDKIFLGIVLALVFFGVLFFISASFGVMARDVAKYTGVLFNQLVFGVLFGLTGLFIASRIEYHRWRKLSLFIFLGGILLTLAVFIPGLGFSHGGATRWLDLGPFSFQPSEILKFGLVLYAAAWFAAAKDRIRDWRLGFLPLIIMITIAAVLLLIQPDTGTFVIIAVSLVAMYLAAGGKWWHAFVIFFAGVILIGVLALVKPYIMDRITTFLNPDDAQGSAYQIRQALIAVGSGGVLGRGFGQSIQKFNYLPEPIGDSIFAVIAEEMGFLGAGFLLLLYLLFSGRGLFLAGKSKDRFGGLLIVGIVVLILSQSLLNIGSMLGMAPLTGVPLIFVSHGGSALLVALFEVGIILNVSRYRTV